MTAVLHGRDPELDRIDAALAAAMASGRGRVIVIQGDAGSGRSALVGAALGLARGRAVPAVVWSGRSDQVGPLPDGPVLVAADDADLAGLALRRALTEVAARIPSAPVVLVASTALAGLDPETAHLFDVPGTERLVLGDLSRRSTAAMLRDALGAMPEAACVDSVYEATRGTPAVIDALAADLRAGAACPRSAGLGRPAASALRAWLHRHLGDPTAPAARLAFAAASAGPRFDAIEAMRVAGLDAEAAEPAYDLLVDRGLVTGPPRAGEFRHSLVRSALECAPGHALRAELRRRDGAAPATRLEEALTAFFAGGPAEPCAATVLDVLDGVPAGAPIRLAAAAPIAAAGRLEEAGAVLDALELRGAESGAHELALAAGGAHAHLLLAAGRVDDADQVARAALARHAGARAALARSGDAGAADAFARAALARAAVRRGLPDAAEAELAQAAGARSPAERAVLVEAAAELALMRGDPLAAAEGAREAGRLLAGSPLDHPALSAWRSIAVRALAALRRTGEALRLADEGVARARATGAPVAVARALAALAAAGPPGPRAGRLAEASALLADGAADGEHMTVLAELGDALRRDGRRAEACAVLCHALTLAEAGGATALAERARDALLAARGTADRPAPGGADALSRSERKVAELAAAGLSNRAIAEQLWVTVKTVELHLTSSYKKLGLHSRRELAAALGLEPARSG